MVPIAAAALVVGGPALASLSAERVELPRTSAEELLTSLGEVDVDAWSGTLTTSVDLGIPGIRGLVAAAGDGAGAGLSAAMLLEGDRTVRVWHDGSGPDSRARLAIVAERGEYSVVRDGATTWTYASDTGAVTKSEAAAPAASDASDGGQDGGQDALPVSPDLLAQSVLLTLDQSSDVSVDGTAMVAGRPAYELVVAPRSRETLVDSLRLAVDAETSLPLRAEVYARGADEPVIAVGYRDLDLSAPDPGVFDFTPPPGSQVELVDPMAGGDPTDPADGMAGLLAGADVRQVGAGFDTVLVGRIPAEALALVGGAGAQSGEDGAPDVLASLPRVSGAWGEGRLLRGTLFSVVLTDDGRVALGPVRPQALYAALAS